MEDKFFTDSIIGNGVILMALPMPGIITYIVVGEVFGFLWAVLAGVVVICLLSPLYPQIIRYIHKVLG